MKRRTIILVCITVFLIIFSAFYETDNTNADDILNEHVEFGGFYNFYKESFELEEDTILRVKQEADIEKGVVGLKIYNEGGEVLYSKVGGCLDEDVVVEATKGKWYYEFVCYNDGVGKEAEDGEYTVLIRKVE